MFEIKKTKMKHWAKYSKYST